MNLQNGNMIVFEIISPFIIYELHNSHLENQNEINIADFSIMLFYVIVTIDYGLLSYTRVWCCLMEVTELFLLFDLSIYHWLIFINLLPARRSS